MEAGLNISYAVSFIAGFLLFFSPCILPLIPSYISYLTGISFKEMSGDLNITGRKEIRISTIIHSFLFILGFSIIFVILGMAVTFAGKFLLEYQLILKKVGAVFIIFFGLAIAGVFRMGILQKEKKIAYRKKGISYFGSLLVGATF
ncbi:MAG: cytochrome c biogenesis protein CcdA, partial [Candidatus Omnitrophica bacterium]|nr:cytochrome c biogenesis protein CcdA [Candidatus Omnitrophota bacterium]